MMFQHLQLFNATLHFFTSLFHPDSKELVSDAVLLIVNLEFLQVLLLLLYLELLHPLPQELRIDLSSVHLPSDFLLVAEACKMDLLLQPSAQNLVLRLLPPLNFKMSLCPLAEDPFLQERLQGKEGLEHRPELSLLSDYSNLIALNAPLQRVPLQRLEDFSLLSESNCVLEVLVPPAISIETEECLDSKVFIHFFLSMSK
mmetsp:Transcript_12371/g.19243  ORF Transcript_12371/g.19243 Transcript_12371/m.19243 type:complete len:200 (-) Transcript_12371:1241-1840(-)